jgi:arylsulfatase A-like enzyme
LSTFIRAGERTAVAIVTAILCSELLLVWSFVRVWGDANSAAFGSTVVDATLSQPIWGTMLGWRLAGFAAALVFTHALLAVASWALAKCARRAWPNSGNSLTVWTLFWLALFTIWILTANAAWFPGSSLGNPYAGTFDRSLYGFTLLHAVTVGVGGFALMTLAVAVRRAWQPQRRRAGWAVGALATGTAVAAFASFGVPHVRGTQTRPHVIVVGLDSLRPDALHSADGKDLAPNINRFLAESTVFGDALTPLARTFPSWVSILSGKHPHTTGAVINLLTRELIDEGDTLPRLLRNTGYRTVYATDEVRFSNIDETYGFDELITPPMGASDFLLGSLGDTPLANLLVNTPAGEWLFPHAYANRAAAITYDPDTFIERLDEDLRFDEPTFFAVHLTLTHWPFIWASTRPAEPGGIVAIRDKYRAAATRLDRQFGDLMQMLSNRGALENAIVVVLSDHGESLGEPTPIAHDENAIRHIQQVRAAIGHGTNVFAREQYHVLLAMRSFGAGELPTSPGETLEVPTSLEDIAPTLAEALGVQPERPFDGVSLLAQLQGNSAGSLGNRIRFLETEFVPPGFGSGTFSPNALRAAATYYRIDPQTARVIMRPERYEEIMQNRQYAATRGPELLAAVPSGSKLEQHLVYLERLGAAPIWLDSAPASPDDLGYELWTALHTRFATVRDRPVAPPL